MQIPGPDFESVTVEGRSDTDTTLLGSFKLITYSGVFPHKQPAVGL